MIVAVVDHQGYIRTCMSDADLLFFIHWGEESVVYSLSNETDTYSEIIPASSAYCSWLASKNYLLSSISSTDEWFADEEKNAMRSWLKKNSIKF